MIRYFNEANINSTIIKPLQFTNVKIHLNSMPKMFVCMGCDFYIILEHKYASYIAFY